MELRLDMDWRFMVSDFAMLIGGAEFLTIYQLLPDNYRSCLLNTVPGHTVKGTTMDKHINPSVDPLIQATNETFHLIDTCVHPISPSSTSAFTKFETTLY